MNIEVAVNNNKNLQDEVLNEYERMCFDKCLTPFKELCAGDLSIHDYLEPGYKVPVKVIIYLKVGKASFVCMGVYKHPFKQDRNLLGPYYMTDDYYMWDRDTWKYVVKYGLKLPQKFIDHVMSEAGTEFIEKQLAAENNWPGIIKKWKKDKKVICLMPDNAGDYDVDNF